MPPGVTLVLCFHQVQECSQPPAAADEGELPEPAPEIRRSLAAMTPIVGHHGRAGNEGDRGQDPPPRVQQEVEEADVRMVDVLGPVMGQEDPAQSEQ